MLKFLNDWLKEPAEPRLRPPGGADEQKLLASCIKCARCQEVCPYQSIRLASFLDGKPYGTPFIDPQKTPCYLCMKCPEVCPTGALKVIEKKKVQMGLARVLEESCLSHNFIICNLCYKRCPLKGEAILLNEFLAPVIDEGACTGCGVCYYVCPADPHAIELKPGVST